MKVLADSNIVLDILLNRSAFFTDSKEIFDLAEKKKIIGYVSASAVTDIFYISSKGIGKDSAREAIKGILSVFYPATVTDNHIYHALDMDWEDFEDSVQFVVGESLAVDYIITRNPQDFSSSSIPAVTPEQFIQTMADIEK
ncbi:MAG: PIN domain-containing protein [Treponema sp.]|nr:PIN domain-containing protein [Treponema sp.]